jgi:hypothetical protein
VWHDKDTPCSKALSAEHRPKVAALSPVIAGKIVRAAINKQTKNLANMALPNKFNDFKGFGIKSLHLQPYRVVKIS